MTFSAPAASSNHWQAHTSMMPQTVHTTSVPSFGGSSNQSAHNSAVHSAVQSLFHHSAAAPTLQHVSANAVSGVNVNLTSAQLNFLANSFADGKTLTIDVGNRQETVTTSTKLTAAELVAVEQVSAGGPQTIILNGVGAAVGGTVNLDNALVAAFGPVNSMTVSHGVRVVDTVSNFDLSGKLTNYGSIVTASKVAGNTDTIAADRIINAGGASIGSYSGGAGLYAANTSLNATTSVTNDGAIGSAGNLNVVTPTIANSGTFTAANGNINLSSPTSISVTGSGSMTASSNINFSTTNGDVNLTGGNFNSQQANFSAANGGVNVNVDGISGIINANANTAFVLTNQAMQIGNICTSGDPLFASQAPITLYGNIAPSGGTQVSATVGKPLTIISGGSITLGDNAVVLDTSNTNGNGGNMTLVAGVNFTGTQETGVKLTNPSATGGSILLQDSQFSVQKITSASTSNQVAGNITFVAFTGSTSNGQIITPSGVTIDASGGAAGQVTIAGGTGGVQVSGDIKNTGTYAGSPVLVGTALPTGTITFDQDGSPTAGAFKAFTFLDGIVQVGNVTTSGPVTIGGGSVSVSGTIASQGFNTPFGNARVPGDGGAVSIQSLDGNVVTGDISSSGGNGGAGATANGGAVGIAGYNGGVGGAINIVAANGFFIQTGNISSTGGNGGAGSTGGSGGFAGGAGGAGGIGGAITLTTATSGDISTGNISSTGGNGGVGGQGSDGLTTNKGTVTINAGKTGTLTQNDGAPFVGGGNFGTGGPAGIGGKPTTDGADGVVGKPGKATLTPAPAGGQPG